MKLCRLRFPAEQNQQQTVNHLLPMFTSGRPVPACCVIATSDMTEQANGERFAARSLRQKPAALLAVLCDFVVQPVVQSENLSQVGIQRGLN